MTLDERIREALHAEGGLLPDPQPRPYPSVAPARRWRAWRIAIAAAAGVIVLIGGVALLVGNWFGDRDAATVPPSPSTTVAAPDLAPFTVPGDLRQAVYQTGLNISGRGELPEPVFIAAAERACSEGGWDWEVAREIAADLLEPIPRDQGGQGAAAVWLMASTACHDRFPQGALDLGPPPD